MSPRLILSRLGQLRRRERLLRFVSGAASLVAVVALVILAGCFADWLWDRSEDTPRTVHVALLSLSCAAAFLGLIAYVLRPQFKRLPDDDLALLVEAKNEGFRNRLISAVQLNRKNADKKGMSEELIGLMTQEAETQAKSVSFAAVADHSRLGRAVKLLVPIAAIVGGLYLWQPEVSSALVARHFLADVDIPRRTHIAPVHLAQVFPANEKIALEFKVTGDGFDDKSEGSVFVASKGQPTDRYPLTFSHTDPKTGATYFVTDVAASKADFDYTARLGDGRTKKSATAKIVPRPAVIETLTYAVLPAYCGVRPSGGRYETLQTRGDIVGIPGSSAKIIAKTQKPVVKADLEILGPEKFDAAKTLDEMGPEQVLRKVPCVLDEDGKTSVGKFDLKPNETAYRIVVEDEYGFKNVPPTRGSLRIVPEEPPTVVLLKDYFTPFKVGSEDSLDDYFVDGIPIPIGSVMRVPYLAEGPYGLGQAWFLYRVLKKTESGNDIVAEEPWKKVALPEVFGTDKTGPFDPRRGIFEKTPPDKGVSFVALPSVDPEHILGRTVGGGRFHFQTGGIPDGKGGFVKLDDGDQIEYCIEVMADKGDTPGRPIARSETRIQKMGTIEGLDRWVSDILNESRRLRDLDNKQRSTFADP